MDSWIIFDNLTVLQARFNVYTMPPFVDEFSDAVA